MVRFPRLRDYGRMSWTASSLVTRVEAMLVAGIVLAVRSSSFVNRSMPRISIFTLTILLLSNSFFPKPLAQELNSFSPEGIQMFLDNNSEVNSAAKFLERLPLEYKQHWIMMTYSESAQTGTATSPRFLLPSTDASKVFGFRAGANAAARFGDNRVSPLR